MIETLTTPFQSEKCLDETIGVAECFQAFFRLKWRHERFCLSTVTRKLFSILWSSQGFFEFSWRHPRPCTLIQNEMTSAVPLYSGNMRLVQSERAWDACYIIKQFPYKSLMSSTLLPAACHKRCNQGPVVQSTISANLGLLLNLLFWFFYFGWTIEFKFHSMKPFCIHQESVKENSNVSRQQERKVVHKIFTNPGSR